MNSISLVKEFFDKHPEMSRPSETVLSGSSTFRYQLDSVQPYIAITGKPARSKKAAKILAYDDYLECLRSAGYNFRIAEIEFELENPDAHASSKTLPDTALTHEEVPPLSPSTVDFADEWFRTIDPLQEALFTPCLTPAKTPLWQTICESVMEPNYQYTNPNVILDVIVISTATNVNSFLELDVSGVEPFALNRFPSLLVSNTGTTYTSESFNYGNSNCSKIYYNIGDSAVSLTDSSRKYSYDLHLKITGDLPSLDFVLVNVATMLNKGFFPFDQLRVLTLFRNGTNAYLIYHDLPCTVQNHKLVPKQNPDYFVPNMAPLGDEHESCELSETDIPLIVNSHYADGKLRFGKKFNQRNVPIYVHNTDHHSSFFDIVRQVNQYMDETKTPYSCLLHACVYYRHRQRDNNNSIRIGVHLIPETFTPNMEAAATPMTGGTTDNAPGSKSMQPVIPNVPSGGGMTEGSPPVHADMPASSTVAGVVNSPNTPQIRASSDMPSQIPLIAMMGGPPNLSQFNMYQDDILNLVYREFDLTQVTVQGGQAKGTIIMSLPYGLNLLNPYAQRWARLHKRYNGRMRLTFSISAVPMLKGNILIGIVRNMPASGTVTFSPVTLQKIKWVILNLNGSGDYSMDIGDARQSEFFRNVDEDPVGADPTNITDRPGIIAVVYTTISNQFGGDADTSVVINVRSQAISPAEDPTFGFYAYEPLDVIELNPTPFNTIPVELRMIDVLPALQGRSLFLDGNKGQAFDYPNQFNGGWSQLMMDPPQEASGTAVLHPQYAPTILTDTWCSMYMTNMSPYYLRWDLPFNGTISKEQLITFITSGSLIKTSGLDNQFLGYSNNLTPTESQHYFSLVADGTRTALKLYYYVAHYTRGNVFVYFADLDSPQLSIGKQFSSDNVPFEWEIRQINATFPTSSSTLPVDYYNCIVAKDNQVAITQPIGGLPQLIPDTDFISAVYNYKALTFANTPQNLLFACDLVDHRDGTLIATLCTFNTGQVVVRTDVPSPGRTHYRFTIDLQYLIFTNPRIVTTVPNSLSSQYLQITEPTRIDTASLLFQKLSILGKDASPSEKTIFAKLSDIFKSESDFVPNAQFAAFVGAGALQGIGQGVSAGILASNKLTLQKNQLFNDIVMQRNDINFQKERQQKDIAFRQTLETSRRNFSAQMRGLESTRNVPGAFVSGNAQPHLQVTDWNPSVSSFDNGKIETTF